MIGLGCLPADTKLVEAVRQTAVGDIDLRSIPDMVDPSGWLLVEDQLHFNSCCGQSMSKCAEWCFYFSNRSTINWSPRYSYLAARRLAGLRNGDSGVSIEAGALAAEKYGLVEEETFPYWRQDELFDETIPERIFQAGHENKIKSQVRAHSALDIIGRLGSGVGPTAFGMWWTAWLANHDGQQPIYRLPADRRQGGHAVAAIGYRKVHDGYLIKVINSHGHRWGKHGTMELSQGVMDQILQNQPFGGWTLSTASNFTRFRVKGMLG